jgi:hypothetical protein
VGLVTLRAWVNDNYVSAASPDGTLLADHSIVGATERFTEYKLAEGGIAFLAANGQYVTAENAGGEPLSRIGGAPDVEGIYISY